MFKGERYHLSFSREEVSGKIMETFVHGPKTGTDMDAVLATACSTISIALQSGTDLKEMEAASLRLEDGSPADIIGVALLALVEADNAVA